MVLMLRFVQCLLLVCSLSIISARAKFEAKVVLDGVSPLLQRQPTKGTFFQGFDQRSCLWSHYKEDIDYLENVVNEGDPTDCAVRCFNDDRCTGFELSYGNAPYCAFWYGGACGHEEMTVSYPSSSWLSAHTHVATYVLMDGFARFRHKACEYGALNMTEGLNLEQFEKHSMASESACTQECEKNANCTGSCSDGVDECDLFFDESCTTSDLDDDSNKVTTLRYPLSAQEPSFTDAYSMCNPYSELLRGYRTCAEYVHAFPCDCSTELGSACTNKNASDADGKGYVWTRHNESQCEGRRLDIPFTDGSLEKCKETCIDNPGCGCFHTQPGVDDHHKCVFYAPKEDTPIDTVTTRPLVAHYEYESYTVTRVSYDPKATLSKLCPGECAAHGRKTCTDYNSSWVTASIIILLTLMPIALAAIFVLAFGRYVRRLFCRSRFEQNVTTPIPAMKEEEINAMEVEEFTCDSELKYGEIECSICIMGFEVGDLMRVMKCGHRFHKDCVDQWLSRYKAVCPLCKNDMRGNGNEGGDVEMGGMCEMDEMTAGDSAGEAGPMPESGAAKPSTLRNGFSEPQPVTIVDEEGAAPLMEPLLENEDSNLLANDALVNDDVVLDASLSCANDGEGGR